MNRNESFFQLFLLHFVDVKQKQRRKKKAGVREIRVVLKWERN